MPNYERLQQVEKKRSTLPRRKVPSYRASFSRKGRLVENPYKYTEGEDEFPRPNLKYSRSLYVVFGILWSCVWVLELLFCLTLLQESYALCRLVCMLLVLHGVVMMFLAFRSAAIGEE